jgi:hypothetical protein
MNERFQLLLKQAGVHLEERRPLDDHDPDGYLESDKDFVHNNHDAIMELIDGGGLSRFAELVVRECASLTRNLSPNGERELAEKAIKRHFGITA